MMKTTGILALAAAAAALLAGCRRPAGELLTINLPELAGAELQTAWTLDGAVNPETYYEMAPDRPLGYVRMTGYHDGLLLVSIRDSVHLVGGDGRFVSSFCRNGNGPQEYLAANMFFDPEGRILALDMMKHRSLTYLTDGTFVSAQDSVFIVDVHFFPDGSRAQMCPPHYMEGVESIFTVEAPDGSTRYASPERDASEKMISLGAGNFIAAEDGSCYFKYSNLDTLYHIRPDRVVAEAVFVRPSKPDDLVEDTADGTVAITMTVGRFVDRSCKVLGDLLFYSFRDGDEKKTHHLVYNLRTGGMLYHGLEAPLLRVGDCEVRTWPVYVHGRDAWCQLTREDAEALLPGYNDDSNNAYLHIVAR
jgi:hypothetical protein